MLKKKIIFLFVFLIFFAANPFVVFGQIEHKRQVNSSRELTESLCYNKLLPTYLDSVLTQKLLDSVLHQIEGKWKLRQIQGGWGIPRSPQVYTEMILVYPGYGEIVENGELTSVLKMKLNLHWGFIRCTAEVSGKDFFQLHPQVKGVIRLCEEWLIIDQHLGDGNKFVFERIK